MVDNRSNETSVQCLIYIYMYMRYHTQILKSKISESSKLNISWDHRIKTDI